jgi:hypothetical protein
MKIKSFIQFLNEMPLPKDIEATRLDPKPGKYSSASIIKKMEELGGISIGKGSSRIAFQLVIEASQFDPKILKTHNLGGTGKIQTVFKIALNPKGIAQNKAEIDNYNTAVDYDCEEYLLPILDTSLRNKKYTYADEELSNWIQMPVAHPPAPGTFKRMFDEMYGKGTLEKFKRTRNIGQLRTLVKVDNNDVSDQQYEDFENFLAALESLQLGIVDLGRPANWGVWNNKLYIIDYGFDDSTQNLYYGSELATAYVDKNGDISLNVTKQAPRNRW